MKKKDIKKFAKKIAKLETIIQNSTDNDEIHMAMNEILTLSGNIKSIVDLEAIDEAVQEILQSETS